MYLSKTKQIKRSIAQGDIESAIEKCLKLLKNSDKEEIAISISYRYNDLKERELKNIDSREQINVEKARISNTILELIKEKRRANILFYARSIGGLLLISLIIYFVISFVFYDKELCDPNNLANYYGFDSPEFTYLFEESPEAIQAPIEHNKIFHLYSDDRKVDGRKKITNSYNFTKWDRNIVVAKKKEADVFKVGYLGGDIRFCKCDPIKKITYYYRSNSSNDKIMKTWQVWFDVSSKKIGVPIQLKFHTLYYRPFHESKGVDMMMYGEFEKISLNLIFDYPNSLKNFHVVTSNEERKVQYYKDSPPPIELRNMTIDTLYPPEGSMLILNWEILNTKFPFTYNLSWETDSEKSIENK